MATIFNHAVQAMALIDPEGQVLQMNQAARQLLPADVDPIGAPFATLPFWSDDPAATAELLQTALHTCLSRRALSDQHDDHLPDGTDRRRWISP